MSGKITDAESGAPLPGARVGIIVLSPLSFVGEFRELTQTDSGGNYSFLHGESMPRVSVRADDYLAITRTFTSAPQVNFSAAMQPIGAIKGTWNVTITLEDADAPASQFSFNELHMEWHTDNISLGAIDYSFDGDTIIIDGFLSAGDVVFGELATTLTLDGNGETLRGAIQFDDPFPDLNCGGPCSGTVEAVRPKK